VLPLVSDRESTVQDAMLKQVEVLVLDRMAATARQ
jgi:hypothetical protein